MEMRMVMRMNVDYDRCTGLGVCEGMAPHVFTLDDDGRMRIVDGSPADALRSSLEDVVAACPTQAITIVD
jgi:ferredoxin